MKKTVFISILCTVFSISLYAQQSNENYYYHQGEKIFLQQSTNKIFLKFAQSANKEQIRSLINSNRSLHLASNTSIDDSYLDFAILEVKNEDDILPSIVTESFKASQTIVSATPLFLYNDFLQGLTDEFAIKLKPTTSYNQLQQLAEKNNCLIIEENQFVKNQFLISVFKNAKLNAMEMSRLFYETGFFEFSEPNFIVFNAFQSNDTYFSEQWPLKNVGQNGGVNGVDIEAERAWTIALGTNIKVAVVDTGVDLTHPDLQANILLPGYEHPSSGNGNGAAMTTFDNHGTACAGIIGAIKDNNKGIAGVAPNCKIMPARITNSASNGFNSNWAATAIDWAWENGADVISNSWGNGSAYQPITDAINRATSQGRGGKGCVVVFATGNNNTTVGYPASIDGVLAVGAMSPCGERKKPNSCDGEYWWGSNYGDKLDIVAPGVLIPTTDRLGAYGYTTGDYTMKFNGTSSACPHVAGVAALVLSVNPNLTGVQVRNIIESTAQKVGGYNYRTTSGRSNGTWSNEMGYGLVNAYAAVLAACTTVNLRNQTINNTQAITGCEVAVNNVTFSSPANVTITGDYRVVVNSMTANQGSRVVIQAGGASSRSNSSPSGGFAVSDALVSSRLLAEENIEEATAPDTQARLYQNTPNPFTGETVIGYYVPDTAHSAYLRFMTATGAVAKAISLSSFGKGEVNISANELSPGVYFYTLVVDGQIVNSRQMIVGN